MTLRGGLRARLSRYYVEGGWSVIAPFAADGFEFGPQHGPSIGVGAEF